MMKIFMSCLVIFHLLGKKDMEDFKCVKPTPVMKHGIM